MRNPGDVRHETFCQDLCKRGVSCTCSVHGAIGKRTLELVLCGRDVTATSASTSAGEARENVVMYDSITRRERRHSRRLIHKKERERE